MPFVAIGMGRCHFDRDYGIMGLWHFDRDCIDYVDCLLKLYACFNNIDASSLRT